MLRLPRGSLVVLAGPSGSGKTTWASALAGRDREVGVVSTDDLRALAGEGPHDQRAGADAFALAGAAVEARVRRGLTTVVDSLGFDVEQRRMWVALGRAHDRPVHAIVFDIDAKTCRARNRARAEPVPDGVLRSQLGRWADVLAGLDDDGLDGVHPSGPVRFVAADVLAAGHAVERQRSDPIPLSFDLQIPAFPWDRHETGARLAEVAVAAEEAGFTAVWVMDHVIQIPQVGREWDDMLESYTTLGYLAAATTTIGLGTLVTGITYRNVAHLAKIVATLDVLSAGRARCGVGAAWFEREHEAYGWDFPPAPARFDILADALALLRAMWAKGTKPFEGSVLRIPETICYPRPIQDHVPILVGGSGEQRTLRLVAEHADACNLFGGPDEVRHKVDVLARHCADVGRDPARIRVTHLSRALTGRDDADLDERVRALTPMRASTARTAARTNAATVDDHVGRFRALAEAGVDTAIVNLADVSVDAVERFAPIVAAFTPS